MVITTAQLHSTKAELRLYAGSNPTRGVSEIRDGEDLWQWSRLEIRLNAFRGSTIPHKQFIIIIYSESLLITTMFNVRSENVRATLKTAFWKTPFTPFTPWISIRDNSFLSNYYKAKIDKVVLKIINCTKIRTCISKNANIEDGVSPLRYNTKLIISPWFHLVYTLLFLVNLI